MAAATSPSHAPPMVGYAFVHTAIDSHTRLAYSEVLDDEKGVTADRVLATSPRLVRRARHHRRDASRPTTVPATRPSRSPTRVEATGARHHRLPPRRPQWNGKVERFNRTLLDEWAYVRVYRSEAARTAALDRWLHLYNHHRPTPPSEAKHP